MNMITAPENWIPIKKRNDWELRLVDWARNRLGMPFEYGKTDCGMLCFEAVDVMSGGSLADHFRSQWNSEASLIRYIKQADTSLLAELSGLHEIKPGFQQIGDLIISEATTDGWQRGHICLGIKSLSATPEHGVLLVPTSAILDVPDQIFHVRGIR